MRKAILMMVLLFTSACNNVSAPDDKWADPASIVFASELGVDLTAMSRSMTGLYSQDLVVGTGETAGVGDRVWVAYSGWLPDGTLIDARGTGAPIDFLLAEGLVIKGWDEGLLGMKVGGRRRLVIPPELAYGRGGRGRTIPPLATLVFIVELTRVEH